MKGIFLALVMAVATFLIAGLAFNTQHATLFGIIVFLVALWTNEALPLGVVSLLPIILFPSLDIISTNATVANYSKSTIFLFLGGFMLAIATQKTELYNTPICQDNFLKNFIP
jgi:sodium-dependent dicarboxylate transporter 2/3/5